MATAILAGSSIALASMISSATRLGNRSQDRIEANLIAQTLIDETISLRPGEVFDEEDVILLPEQEPRWGYRLSSTLDVRRGMIVLTVDVFPASDELNSSREAESTAHLVRWYLPPNTEDFGRDEIGQSGVGALR